ncbi:WD40-repeat-containing domain protein [Lentinula raphanica]|nr:WD40-repeat-containing domain protein [Lentinula raphanica]
MLGPSYNVLGSIEDPSNAVNALAFSDDGRYLASASHDMFVRVHDLKRHLLTMWTYHGKSPFTTVVWFKGNLFAGNGDGEVMIFWHPTTSWFRKQRMDIIAEFYAPIHSLELNQSGDQLLVCSGSRVTLLIERKSGHWKLRCHFDPPSSFEETIEFGEPDGFDEPQVLATSAHFLQEKDCVIAGYLHHGLWKHRIETGTSALVWGPDEKIGFTALSPDGTALVIANVRSGIDWLKVYPGPTKWRKISASLEIQDPSGNIPLPVQFIDKGKYVIMGTSKGYAVIFHARHGKKVISLDHGNDKTWVTALAYVHPKNQPQLIATGDGNCGTNSKIRVWVEDVEEKQTTGSNTLSVPLMKYAHVILNIVRNVSAIVGVTIIFFLLLPPMWREAVEVTFPMPLHFAALVSLKPPAIIEHTSFGDYSMPSVATERTMAEHSSIFTLTTQAESSESSDSTSVSTTVSSTPIPQSTTDLMNVDGVTQVSAKSISASDTVIEPMSISASDTVIEPMSISASDTVIEPMSTTVNPPDMTPDELTTIIIPISTDSTTVITPGSTNSITAVTTDSTDSTIVVTPVSTDSTTVISPISTIVISPISTIVITPIATTIFVTVAPATPLSSSVTQDSSIGQRVWDRIFGI